MSKQIWIQTSYPQGKKPLSVGQITLGKLLHLFALYEFDSIVVTSEVLIIWWCWGIFKVVYRHNLMPKNKWLNTDWKCCSWCCWVGKELGFGLCISSFHENNPFPFCPHIYVIQIYVGQICMKSLILSRKKHTNLVTPMTFSQAPRSQRISRVNTYNIFPALKQPSNREKHAPLRDHTFLAQYIADYDS